MNKTLLKKLFCYILFVATLLNIMPFDNAAAIKTAGFVSRLDFDLEDSTVVRAIVVYDGDAGIELEQSGQASSAQNGAKTVKSDSAPLTKAITKDYGATLVYSYGVLLNGVAVDISYGQLKQVEKLQGVKGVYLANSYSAPEYTETPSAALAAGSAGLGADSIPGNGAGAVIAILDTSFYLKHSVFSQTSGVKETLTAQKLQTLKDSAFGLNGRGEYISAKVPYAYDYADEDINVSNSATHGTAVASIALGDDGGDFHGIARNAQLLAMKVFGDASGNTDSSIYFYALEDAYTLGADVINMSFGAQNGFTFDSELENVVFGNIYKKLREAGVFVICAAGNEYSQGYGNYAYNHKSVNEGVDAVTADYADYGVVGTPSTYGDNISVAAAENGRHYAYGLKVAGTAVEYFDNADSLYEHFYSNFAGRSMSYVLVPGNGTAADYASLNVAGKIAVVNRGGITHTEKLSAAAQNGAAGLICYNDRPGMFYVEYDNYVIPSAAITMQSYQVLKNAPTKQFTVSMSAVPVDNYRAGRMCDFSSWGVTPDLLLKPNITGIGGDVLCAGVSGTEEFVLMSGTSMAAPTIAGFFAAVLVAYEYDAGTTRAEKYELVYSLIFSTATTLYDENGAPYSPRKQGVGMPTSTAAGQSPLGFDTPVINLGHDPQKNGVYTIKANLNSLFAVPNDYTVSFSKAEVLTDRFVYDEENGNTYNTLSSYSLSPTVTANKQSYTVGESKDSEVVEICVTLSEADKAYLAAAPNGAYIEGYIYFTFNNGGSDQTVKLTFMGFYGDWCSAPTFERYDWGDIVDTMVWLTDTVEPSTGKTYADLGYTVYDKLEMNVGYNEAYLTTKKGEDIGFFGDNLYKNVSFNADRLAISSGAASCDHLADRFTIYPSLLRNVEHIIMTVSNAETGQVYYVDDTVYAMKNFYDTTNRQFGKGTYFQWDGTYTDKLGKSYYVPNNTKVKVTFQTQLAFNGAPLTTQREYYVYVDYEAPEINYSWDASAKTLTVLAKDNRYISNIFVFAGDYELYAVEDAIESSVCGEYYSVTYDLSDADFGTYNTFYLEVQDYATNYVSVKIPLATDSANINGLLGDINSDGSVDNLDAATILRYDAAMLNLAQAQITAADVNGDGSADNLDAALILKYDAGLSSGFGPIKQ